MKTLNKR